MFQSQNGAPAPTTQAYQFLKQMRQMSPRAEQVFREIYAQAPKKSPDENTHSLPRGQHVRLAMIAAPTHPEIAYWTRMNLAVRVARKLAQTTGQHNTAQRLEQTLEAFHQAADAFVCQQAIKTQQRTPLSRPTGVQALAGTYPAGTYTEGYDLSAEEVSLIQRFKSHIIPGLAQRIRAGVIT